MANDVVPAVRALKAQVSNLGIMFLLIQTWSHVKRYVSVGEYLDNGADSGGSELWCLVDGEKASGGKSAWMKVSVFDNGSGMGPYMLDNDRGLVKYAERIDNLDILKTLIAENSPSYDTLEWMIEHYAQSAKAFVNNPNVRGTKHSGSLSGVIYSTVTYKTRPSLELAKKLEIASRSQDYGYFKLVLPDLAQFRKGELTCIPERVKAPLLDPWGHPLEHGTVVELDISNPEEEDLLPQVLANYFSKAFGADIGKRYQITVIDRITNEARQSREGRRIIPVQPVVYKGILVKEGKVYADSQHAYAYALYYNPRGTDEEFMVRRLNRSIFPLHQLSRFAGKDRFWASGKVSGYVDFEAEGRYWDGEKQALLDSEKNDPLRNHWEQALLQLEKEVQPEIDAMVDAQKDQADDQDAKIVASAVVEAMIRNEELQAYVPLGARTNKPSTITRRASRETPPIVVAKVKNEYNKPLPGIEVQLWQKNSRLDMRVTGKSGSISFGRVGPGKKYRLRLGKVDSKFIIQSQSVFEFDLEENQGAEATFVIQTGMPDEERPSYPRLRISMEKFDEPFELYDKSHLRTLGLIRINRLEPRYYAASRRDDRVTTKDLINQYAAAAIAEDTFSDCDSHELLANFERLYNDAKAILSGVGGRIYKK